MGFTIPDNDLASNNNQSIWFATDIAILTAGLNGVGVISGCAVSAQGSPDMTVAVAAGTIKIADGTLVTVASGNLTITTANATNPRIDLISVSNSGTKTVTDGTAAANPKPPDLPSGNIALAMVYVPANDTTIGGDQITDKRVILTATGLSGINLLGYNAYDPGSHTTVATITATTGTDVDATNMKVTFTAPPSGAVVVGMESLVTPDNASPYTHAAYWGLRSGSTDVALNYLADTVTAAQSKRASMAIVVTGLTPGTSYTYKWSAKVASGGSMTILAGGDWGQAIMRVWDAGTSAATIARLQQYGTNLIGLTAYTAGSDTALVSSNPTTATDIDATNAKVVFVAPPSGAVYIHLSALGGTNNTSNPIYYGVRDGSTLKSEAWAGVTTNAQRYSVDLYVSGLTPGTTYTYKMSYRMSGSGTTGSIYAGPTYGPLVMAVMDAGTPAATSGTSFPSSPASGQQFFRTDLGYDCYYDGTRWLTTTLYLHSIDNSENQSADFTGSRITVWEPLYDQYMVDFFATVNPQATNDGSHYWTVNLRAEAVAGGSASTIATFNTSADTQSVWTRHRVAINALLGSTIGLMYVQGAKTSTPGNLYLASAVTYRLVIT